jgi:H+-translocating NAD(P) transhydrogenase subunit beta
VNHEVARLLYLLASVLFILGLKGQAGPRTARGGNALGIAGMVIAIGTMLTQPEMQHIGWLIGAIVVGTAVGWVIAVRVQMTAMPQMVALLNGLGGLASALVSMGDSFTYVGSEPASMTLVTALGGVLIGGVTFTGSLLAFAKLQGLVSSAPWTFPFQKLANLGLLLLCVLFSALFANSPDSTGWLVLVLLLSLGLGLFAVAPIGGADMPVVIALLNSYSGLAGAATGYILANDVLIVAGALVGASGIILSVIMCKAMNRSLANVLFGAFGTGEGGAGAAVGPQKTVRNYSPTDAAVLLTTARSVVIAPGYGLAVAQAQHVVKELTLLLEERGVDVKFAIHPVAGRMPGHMNILLAESDLPYSQLLDMDQANPLFESADVALVVGANDVVNPIARTDKTSPIYGMPILDADKSRNVIILKRSLASGFAGIDNPLFYAEKTMMLFGDAKKTLMGLVAAVKTA